jgi:Fe-S cluster assembly protein SufD
MIEQSYISLFEQQRKTIDGSAPAIMNLHRDAAFAVFKQKGFPARNAEEYLHCNIDDIFAPDYGMNLRQAPLDINPYERYRCHVSAMNAFRFYLLNDYYPGSSTPQYDLPDGVFAGGMQQFALEYPEVFQQYYNRLAQQGDSVAAFNTMFVQNGFVLYLPDKCHLHKPLQLIHLLFGQADYLINSRLLVIAGKNSHAKILFCAHTADSVRFAVTRVAEIYAQEGAQIDLYEVEESSEKTARISSLFIQQESGSRVLTSNLTLSCGFSRNNYRVSLCGAEASVNVTGMSIAGKTQYVDNCVFIDHVAERCQSNQLFKYVLQEESTGAFCGRILVEKGAQKTAAYQSNKNLCTSPAARMFSSPQLEIYADDVKCSHGLTTGQLDRDALFYMQARGIPAVEARMLLLQAFMEDVLQHIQLENLQQRLRQLVGKRFRGDTNFSCSPAGCFCI